MRVLLPMPRLLPTPVSMYQVDYVPTKELALFELAKVVLLWVQQWNVDVDMTQEVIYKTHKEPRSSF